MTHNVLVAVESETGVRLEGDGLAAKLLEVRGLIQAVVENEAVAVGDGEGSRRSKGGAMAGTIPEAFAEIADVLRRMKAGALPPSLDPNAPLLPVVVGQPVAGTPVAGEPLDTPAR